MSDHSTLTFVLLGINAAGLAAAVDALFTPRSSQATIAWILSLIFFPYAALPIYLIFGRRRFVGYRKVSRRMKKLQAELARNHPHQPEGFSAKLDEADLRHFKTLETIAGATFLADNHIRLLTSGEEFFENLLEEIRKASKRICLCFYIVRDDNIGRRFRDELLAAAARGVEVWFLYDEVGSSWLSSRYVQELKAGGVEIVHFYTRRGRRNFFQVNFRNHRKIAVIDHRVAYVGGFNIGDEYIVSEALGVWRDTQICVTGPAVASIESVFRADWVWATQTTPKLATEIPERSGAIPVLTVATGPTDEYERCLLFFQELFASANRRLWLATPYFVPDESLIQTLKLAAIRGVDVRLIVPEKSDFRLAGYAAISYLPELQRGGVKVHRYMTGFMHQKVTLVDDRIAAIGSANLDNRSLRLAFEVIIAAAGKDFVASVESMLMNDFKKCELMKPISINDLPIVKRIIVTLARLLSPIL